MTTYARPILWCDAETFDAETEAERIARERPMQRIGEVADEWIGGTARTLPGLRPAAEAARHVRRSAPITIRATGDHAGSPTPHRTRTRCAPRRATICRTPGQMTWGSPFTSPRGDGTRSGAHLVRSARSDAGAPTGPGRRYGPPSAATPRFPPQE